MPPRECIGDGVYVSFDGFGITLVTSNGEHDTNQIYIEPEVYAALLRYTERLRRTQPEAKS